MVEHDMVVVGGTGAPVDDLLASRALEDELLLLVDVLDRRDGRGGRRGAGMTSDTTGSAPNQEVTADQVANAHPAVRQGMQGAVDEYEAGETPEAIVARDADKLECLVQAVECREQAAASPRTGSTPASPR